MLSSIWVWSKDRSLLTPATYKYELIILLSLTITCQAPWSALYKLHLTFSITCSVVFLSLLYRWENQSTESLSKLPQFHVASKSLIQDSNPGRLAPVSRPLEMMHLEPLHYVWPQQVLAKGRLLLGDAHWKQPQSWVHGGLRMTDRSGWLKPFSADLMPQFGQISLEVGVLSCQETGFRFVISPRAPTMCQALGKQWGTK